MAGSDVAIHLNNAGAALMPKTVANAIRNYITEEEMFGGYETADRKRAEIDLFYSYGAQLLNCKSQNIAFTTNATDSYNRALSSIPFKTGDVILVSENDYPSNFIVLLSLQQRFGVVIVRVANTATGEIDLCDLEEKIRKHQPRLLSVTHIPTSSGLVQPVEEIGRIVKKYDTLYLLDACQSLGQLNVDAITTGADFISGTFRKFLRGPRGAGILYVSDKALEAGFEPLFIDLRGAEWVEENKYIPRKDAKRFEDWETAYALMMGSSEALKYLFEIGIDQIESRNSHLMQVLKSGLSEIDFIKLQDRGKQQSNILTFSCNKRSQTDTKKYFTDHNINIYTTPKTAAIIDFAEKNVEWVVRVSPHYYNTETELEKFIQVVEKL
ncbi:aminotransferase class V-fold PLP-dependent enzyme [Pedobacter sp. UBA5917]|jgi:selenocysteine lyase/cysteine desulfurase|uniref:aminotransferase class V-fold PLP-dependent enzyme n=1 Tax=Pedobacter sp. UBA5917 TaxID=1947061 RepID=UPI0025DF77EC|nr:aminotransferase class V-fold PLP-dependent enzyme [Pedobacter sp. UBA5917]